MEFYNTRTVADILGIRADALSRAVWLGRIEQPSKSPAGDYLWTEQDIERASWVLLHRAYEPHRGANND